VSNYPALCGFDIGRANPQAVIGTPWPSRVVNRTNLNGTCFSVCIACCVGMFRKAPHVKNLSVLRSTDRKKTIQQIVQLYHLQHVDPETRNSLLPEGAQVQAHPQTNTDLLRSLQSSPQILMSLEHYTTMPKVSSLCG
jgi:hypothetical protein